MLPGHEHDVSSLEMIFQPSPYTDLFISYVLLYDTRFYKVFPSLMGLEDFGLTQRTLLMSVRPYYSSTSEQQSKESRAPNMCGAWFLKLYLCVKYETPRDQYSLVLTDERQYFRPSIALDKK